MRQTGKDSNARIARHDADELARRHAVCCEGFEILSENGDEIWREFREQRPAAEAK